MKKGIAIVCATLMCASISTVALAKSMTCEVTAVEENTVTLQCETTDGLSVSDSVKVKPKAKKAIEGC